MEQITVKIYTLRKANGSWLGQIVLTSDGMYSSVTDWGNFSYAWRSTGEKDFRNFFINMDEDYFAGKMYSGITYIANGKKIRQACDTYAQEIFPALQKAIKAELESELNTVSQ